MPEDEASLRTEIATTLREIAAALDSPQPLSELVPSLTELLNALQSVVERQCAVTRGRTDAHV